jgi:hypothetical protein
MGWAIFWAIFSQLIWSPCHRILSHRSENVIQYFRLLIGFVDEPDPTLQLGPILQNTISALKLYRYIFLLSFWTNFRLKEHLII